VKNEKLDNLRQGIFFYSHCTYGFSSPYFIPNLTKFSHFLTMLRSQVEGEYNIKSLNYVLDISMYVITIHQRYRRTDRRHLGLHLCTFWKFVRCSVNKKA